MDRAQQRLAMMAQLQGALDLAEQLNETVAVRLIECALNEVREKLLTGDRSGEDTALVN